MNSPPKKPVTRGFECFVGNMNMRLNKQSSRRRIEGPWGTCDVIIVTYRDIMTKTHDSQWGQQVI